MRWSPAAVYIPGDARTRRFFAWRPFGYWEAHVRRVRWFEWVTVEERYCYDYLNDVYYWMLVEVLA